MKGTGSCVKLGSDLTFQRLRNSGLPNQILLIKLKTMDKLFLRCLILGLVSKCAFGAPDLSGISKVANGHQVLVITTTETAETETPSSIGSVESSENDLGTRLDGKIDNPVNSSKPRKPEIYSFKIHSDIKYRYSTTSVVSRVANRDAVNSQEVAFRVVLPETAFISKFLMEIDGKSYQAYVKEKEAAKQVYSEAVQAGQSAGLVEMSTRNANSFDVNVNIKAQSKVTFNLTYEELLTRRLGRYEQAINIIPEVPSVKDFQISVNIEESQNITFLRVPNLRNDIESDGDTEGNDNKDAIILRSGNKANITWSPSVEDQEKLSKQGVGGKFVLQYDVNRDSTSGEVLVMEGYFVHFFAPENLKPLKKHVVFILDVSGSMHGVRLRQLKASQRKILDDLTPDDYFNIITFSSDVLLWSPSDEGSQHSDTWNHGYHPRRRIDPRKQQPYPATAENIAKAKSFIDSLVASGGTNIHDSIITAINLTSLIKNARDGIFSPDEPEIEIPEPLISLENASGSSASGGSSEEQVTEPASTIPTTTRPLVQRGTKNILPKNVESMIIFLTDGEPTVGITDPTHIQNLIQAANKNLSLPIFSLRFGDGADFPFLRKLSLQNFGFARKIYEASDAALQLKGFYNEIASPLLAHVKFNYTSPEYNVTDVTVTSFPTFFGGTEIAVAGRLIPLAQTAPTVPDSGNDNSSVELITVSSVVKEDAIISDSLDAPSFDSGFILSDKHLLDVGIFGVGHNGSVTFKPPQVFCHPIDPIDFDIVRPPFPPRPTPPPTQEDTFMERLWAYLTIQQLIEKDVKEDGKMNEHEKLPNPMQSDSQNTSESGNGTTRLQPETPKQQAVRIALKYGFVTPFTSLVVVKPNSSEITDAKPADGPSPVVDNFAAPQTVNYFAVAQPLPQALQVQSYPSAGAHRISNGGWGSYHVAGGVRKRRPIASTTLPAYTRPVSLSSAFASYDSVDSAASVEEEADSSVLSTPANTDLTIDDLAWFNRSDPIFRKNGTDYTILSQQAAGVDDSGYDCSVSEPGTGQCVHLKECIKQAFGADVEIYRTNYFCPITSTSPSGLFAGVCCSSVVDTTVATPFLP